MENLCTGQGVYYLNMTLFDFLELCQLIYIIEN